MDNDTDRPNSGTCTNSDHTVHILESGEAELMTLCEDLTLAGFRVSGSSDPERAMEYLARTHPDVLICDLAGLEIGVERFLERARRASLQTRIILTSDRPRQPAVDHVEIDSGADLLLGPLSTWSLLRALERILAKEPEGRRTV